MEYFNPTEVDFVSKFGYAPSDEQLKILETFTATEENLVINAVAGSGKTTTLQQIVACIPPRYYPRVCYLSFSKKLCNESKAKLPSGIEVKTLHSYGYASVRSKYPSVKVDTQKYESIIRRLTSDHDFFNQISVPTIRRLIEYFRITHLKGTASNLVEVLEDMGIDYEGDFEYLIQLMRKCMITGLEETQTVDLTDQIYFPSLGKTPVSRKYDLYLTDESQDLNSCTISILDKITKTGARVVAVGDPKQTIFGFAGSDHASFDRVHSILLKSERSASLESLSTCYRCFDQLLDVVKIYLPIQGTGKQGTYARILKSDFYNLVTAGDLVLCRVNAPLVTTALEFLSQGIPVKIEGRAIGEDLKRWINAAQKKNPNFDEFANSLNDVIYYRMSRTTSESRLQSLQDQKDCLIAIYENNETAKSFPSMIALIDTLFSDSESESNQICFSSIHRSKGLEADRVFLMLRNEFNGPGNGQESNLEYVARTRAKKAHYEFMI